MMYIIVDNFL